MDRVLSEHASGSAATPVILRRGLHADAVVSGVAGIGLTLGADPLGDALSLPPPRGGSDRAGVGCGGGLRRDAGARRPVGRLGGDRWQPGVGARQRAAGGQRLGIADGARVRLRRRPSRGRRPVGRGAARRVAEHQAAVGAVGSALNQTPAGWLGAPCRPVTDGRSTQRSEARGRHRRCGEPSTTVGQARATATCVDIGKASTSPSTYCRSVPSMSRRTASKSASRAASSIASYSGFTAA